MRKWIFLMTVAVVVSGITVVHVRHQNRLIFVALQEVQQQRDRLNIEWRRLLLEESTWSMHQLVENNARKKLGMTTPSSADMAILSGQVE